MSYMTYQYNCNKSYRKAFREYFNMETKQIESTINKDYDDETIDELLYDEKSTQYKLNEIKNNTENNALFDELYCLAAAKLLSTEKDTGLCILLCYDYFADFVPLYETFLREPDSIIPLYEILKKKLSN